QLSRSFSHACKKFLIPVRAFDSRWNDPSHHMPKIGHKGDNLVLCLLMQGRIANNSAFAYFRALQFELGFYERENHSTWSYYSEGVRQHHCQRNKGNVDHAHLDRFGNVLTC